MRSQAARQLLALILSGACGPLAAAAPAPLTVAASTALSPAASVALSPVAAAPTAVPAPVKAAEPLDSALLPQAPGVPTGSFLVLTRSGASPQPTVRLSWAPAEPGDFIVVGYRVYRSSGSAWVERPEGASAPVEGLSLEDPVHVGSRYQYVVEAVDKRGKAGPRSPAGTVDLAALPPEQLAPRAPQGVSASSRRYDVLLHWDAAPAWVAPVSVYNVYRADSAEALPLSSPIVQSGTNLTITPPAQGQLRWYAISTVDADGRVSPMSATVSAQATGTVLPGAPAALTTRARTEKVSLAWQAAQEGTAPVSGYILMRRPADEDQWRQVAKLGPQARDYNDSAPGDQGYLYSLAAFDAEGNTGPVSYVGASPSAKLLNKTLIVTMPTAYANLKDRDRGLNLNVLFDFYVGSLFESYHNPTTDQTKTGQLQPLQIATVSTDTKWALLDDRGLIPGLAAGLYISALINFGQPTGGAQSVGISSSGGGIATLGNAYVVMSKRFWPGQPRAVVHGGYFRGGLADSIAQDPLPRDWFLTIRHLLPGGDLPSLFSRFVDPKLGAQIGQSPDMAFAGIQFPFTVPLIFTQWHTGLRLEYMAPMLAKAEFAPSSQPLPALDPSTQLPWLLNVHIDNLPLFGFEFGYFQYPGGYQLIAFYHIPDLTWAW